MKSRLAILAAVVAAVAVAAGPRLLAHHSFAAEFDGSKPIRLTGALAKIEWTNPHSYFYIDVKDQSGSVVTWGCEAGSPGALSRRGFKRGDLRLGDTVIVDGYLAKDGSHLVDARRVTLPDGRIVSGASAGDGGPGEATQER
jgi:hypothetical protein